MTVDPSDALLVLKAPSVPTIADLNLIGPGSGFTLRTLGSANGTGWGAADPVVAMMDAFLQDGATAQMLRHNDRTMPIIVQVLGSDAAALAAGEAALTTMCRQTWDLATSIELHWTPPADGPECVFDVTLAKAPELVDWADYSELHPDQLGRLFKVELTALPFARSGIVVKQTIAAPASSAPVTPTVTSIDACSSTTGWSVVGNNGSLSTGTDAGDTYVRGTAPSAFSLKKSGLSINMTTSPYVIVRFAATYMPQFLQPVPFIPTVKLNGVAVDPIAQSGNTCWYPFSGTLNTVELVTSYSSAYIKAYDLSRTDMVAPGVLTQLEVSRQFPIQGSVRSPATIGVRGVRPSDQATQPLGQCLVFTTPKLSSQAPPLRTLRVDGGSDATDTTAYSGKKSALSTVHRFQIPMAAVAQAGHVLVSHLQAASTGVKTLSWVARTIVNGSPIGDTQSGTLSVNITAVNTWYMIATSRLTLPTTATGPLGVVEIQLSSSSLVLDEAWLCDIDNGQVTILDCGANGYLWLDAPNAVRPAPTIWIGTASDRSDAYVAGPEVLAWGNHQTPPPKINVFVAAASPPEVAVSNDPAWTTHAGVVTP